MIRNQKTGRMETLESLAEIHRFLPELQREVALQFFSVSNIGSSEVTYTEWIEIADMIHKHYDEFEGFVVIHGTNTMSYTAAALSFAFQNLSKPIILTGALIPINDLASDGRMNLIFAIRAAELDIAEVCIVLGPTILRGNRAVKVEQSILQTFESPHFPALGHFGTTVHLEPWRTVRRKRTLESMIAFDTNVLSLTLHPGIPASQFDALLSAKPNGIVIRSYGQGMLSEGLFPWLREVARQGIPVVIASQMLRGRIDMHLYEKQLFLEEIGVISGNDMTYECAIVKLMWALAQTKKIEKIRTIMEKDLVGELTAKSS